ncbi:MAG: hypothetical protein AABZ02_00705 [Bacteroidota bacterium]
MKTSRTILWVTLFSIAFAFVEASVVVYLQAIYYPEGFSFPLRLMSSHHIGVELSRELATVIMLAAVGILAGKSRWQKFSYFLIAFGVWDIFYYVWLKLALNWPATLFDWDILFLIPVPWIGPVIAPVLVSIVMIAGGLLMIRREEREGVFRTTRLMQLFALVGTAMILLSFLYDVDATLRFQMPKPYRYELLAAGLSCYVVVLSVIGLGSKPKR